MIFIKNKGANSPIYIPRNNIKPTSEGSNTDYVTDVELKAGLSKKQDTLVSGKSIKTINNESLLGEGNIDVVVDLSDYATKEEVGKKQDQLVSTQNIKTINGNDILGSGDIVIEGGNGNIVELTQAEYDSLSTKDAETLYLITDETIDLKTINGVSLIGGGDISVATEEWVLSQINDKLGAIETALTNLIGQ